MIEVKSPQKAGFLLSCYFRGLKDAWDEDLKSNKYEEEEKGHVCKCDANQVSSKLCIQSRVKKYVDFSLSRYFGGLKSAWDEDLKSNNLLKWKYKRKKVLHMQIASSWIQQKKTTNQDIYFIKSNIIIF